MGRHSGQDQFIQAMSATVREMFRQDEKDVLLQTKRYLRQ
jgi:hypothetical protein